MWSNRNNFQQVLFLKESFIIFLSFSDKYTGIFRNIRKTSSSRNSSGSLTIDHDFYDNVMCLSESYVAQLMFYKHKEDYILFLI